MARRRLHGESLVYAEAHRHEIPELWKRNGHRVDSADRDWTEYAHGCREPLALIEEYRDIGQNLYDKNFTMTKRMAERAQIPAYMVAWRVNRPKEVDEEIERLQRRVLELEAQYPITQISARMIYPTRTRFQTMQPSDWWLHVCAHHADHYTRCSVCQQKVAPVQRDGLETYKERSALWSPMQLRMREAA